MYDQTFQPGTQEPSRSIASQTSTTEQHSLLEALQSSQPKLDPILIALPFGLITIWTIALIYVRQQQRRINHRLSHSDRLEQRHQVPCRSCIFFKDNPYLRCAANPADALTPRAIDCTDYAPHAPPSHRKWAGKS